MEVLVEEQIDMERVADLCAVGTGRPPPLPRDRSVFHVTNLLESGRLIAKGNIRYHERTAPPTGIMSLGRVWESAVDHYLADYAAQKGGVYTPDVELEEDGVVASLDGLLFLCGLGLMVVETKLRFTLNTSIPLQHLQQVRAYCHIAGTDLVCYVSGHLSSAPPTSVAFLLMLRLPCGGIAETWEGIMATKRYLEEHGCTPFRVP